MIKNELEDMNITVNKSLKVRFNKKNVKVM
jgi:hypothetical protein